jgi:hypothetical protein
MPDSNKRVVVFVHGWSVHNTSTYGEFPARLRAEARGRRGIELEIKNIWLSKYVSFRDEVRVRDISQAFEAAVRRELANDIAGNRRVICITHSTGGPVIRDWWDRFYVRKGKARACPMSHLIMLAPANFGSALAQLGKSRLGRIKSWFQGVEPGSGVLDWLELGSPESWDLNQRWFDYPDTTSGRRPVFPFVLTGQQIDRNLYDHVNSYTGEIGSDGVVRVAAANLNARYVQLVQNDPKEIPGPGRPDYQAPGFKGPIGAKIRQTYRTAFGLIEGRSHSGNDMGILKSVGKDSKPHPTVEAVLDCICVGDGQGYQKLCDKFDRLTENVQKKEYLEHIDVKFMPDRFFIHDPHSMIIFRIRDDRGFVVTDFDLKYTARTKDRHGKPISSPNHLPRDFMQDRQRNHRDHGMLTFFLNYAMMIGCPRIPDDKNPEKTIRAMREKSDGLGFEINHHSTSGIVHHLDVSLPATARQLRELIKPNQTTMIDITLRRMIREGVFRLEKWTENTKPVDFKDDPDGSVIDL